MLEKSKVVIFILITVIQMSWQYITPSLSDEDVTNNTKIEDNTQKDEISYSDLYKMLNNKKFHTMLFENSLNGITQKDIDKELKKIEGEFIEIPYEGKIFSPSLISLFQETLYKSYGDSPINIENAKAYFDLLKELGSQEYELTKKEIDKLFPQIAEHYESFFRFNLSSGQENYLFCFDSGGSFGGYNIELTQLKNDKFIKIASFDTQNDGYGKVIKYEQDFYYVFLQYNYNLKNYDGIRIHKLGKNAKTENILIRFIPEEYIWKTVYNNLDGNKKLTEYIESIQNIVTSKYIETGLVNIENYFIGDEIKDLEFPLNKKYQNYYKSDFANQGIPIFMRKSLFAPSNSRTTLHLKASFYLYNPKNEEVLKLNKLELNKYLPLDRELIQMWFKELDGKVFTFQIFHLDNYNYMMNVILVEGNQVIQIRKELLLPKRKIVMDEGRIQNNGI